MIEPYKLPHIMTLSQLMADSYKRWTGWELVGGRDIPYALYFAPFPITSFGTQDDPLIQYANLAALEAWDTTWIDFIGMPARVSTQPDQTMQNDRYALIQRAKEKGWAMNYTGERISRTGKRFQILNTVLWQLEDAQGHDYGYAARIGSWSQL